MHQIIVKRQRHLLLRDKQIGFWAMKKHKVNVNRSNEQWGKH